MERLKAGLIGCGTIGSELASFLSREWKSKVTIAYLCDSYPGKARILKRTLRSSAEIVSFPTLIQKSNLIIEAASAQISGKVAKDALRLGKKVLIMSVGGLIQDTGWRRYLHVGADPRVRPMLGKANGPTPSGPTARQGRRHGSAPTIYIPSGAVAGIDGLLAASEGRVRNVRLITRKPPKGLEEAPYFKQHAFPRLRGREEKLIFKGSAQQAVKAFPANINVSAVLSLAGLGAGRTEVEIWTSRAYRWNEHEVAVESDAGLIRTVTRNVPSKENPKTSRLAILSAKAVLRKIFSSLKIGT